MTRKIYALLVGIDDYDGGVRGLNGCVNDVKRMREFLELRTQGGEFALEPLLLTSGDSDNPNEDKPKRQRVIDAFRQHLCQAGPDDVALFYYSGHGSQEKTPPELWRLEPDHLDETIVCYDSRTEGSWDLADKELAVLISEVAKNNPHLVVILDSCHSGSGTRGPEAAGVRLAPRDARERPLDTLEGMAQIQARAAAQPGGPSGGWLELPEGRHVVLSACRDEEVANERFMPDGQCHGLLSYYLLDSLRGGGSGLTYRDIAVRVSTLVRNQVAQQNPVIEAADVSLLQQPFLGGAVRPQPPYFVLTYHADGGWAIDGGAVHGIQPPSGGETTTLAVFPAGTDLGAVTKMNEALGFARVTQVDPGQSRVELTLTGGQPPDRKAAYLGLVVSVPLPPLTVRLLGDEAGLAFVRQALATAAPGGKPSLIVRELALPDQQAAVQQAGRAVAPDVLAQLTLTARDGRYLVRRSDDAYPLMVPVEAGYTVEAARMAVQRLEHVATWLQLAQLDNKTSRLPPGAVAMEVYAANPDGSEGARLDDRPDIRLAYEWQDGKALEPRCKMRLVNRSQQRLYCMLLDMTEAFAVHTAGLLPGGGQWLAPGEEVWAYEGKPIPLYIPKAIRALGVVTFRDVLKLIASTVESNATLLERNALDVATRDAGASVPKDIPRSPLTRLMNRIQTRDLGTDAEEDELVADWVAGQVTITTVCPPQSVAVPGTGRRTAPLSDVVSIESHPALQAQARLTTFGEGTRDAGNLALPRLFRDHPELGRPAEFSASRGGEPGLSVLELSVRGDTYRQVTREQPLVLRVAQPLGADEYVLPVGFDAQAKLFLPLGRCEPTAEGYRVRIERLPTPDSGGARDVAGSLKLFFQKMVGKKIGLAGATAQLRAATVGADGQVTYYDDVAQRVQAAQRILLYVHGYLGDTRGMIGGSRSLAGKYDLILAFDYENINTPVEDTALTLKGLLQAVGLGAGHGKTLHIAAHSLGCLVTRQFIEGAGGNKIAQKALLAGAPNCGTPWAKIEDLVLLGLGAVLNGLAALAWPPSIIPTLIGVLSTIVGGVEKVDTTVDELKPDSDFLRRLNAADDPGVPYALIVGNTSLIQAPAAAEQPLLEALVDQLTSKETKYRLASLAFLKKPNDYAIGVASMEGLPAGRAPAPQVLPVACDHASYFLVEVGLEALAAAV